MSNTTNNATVTPIKKTSAPKKTSTGRKRATGKRARQKQLNRLENVLTLVLGCGIPALSLALSRIAGAQFAAGHVNLAAVSAGLVLCVLAVSLSHVAEAIREVTGAERWLSWALAVAIDASLVSCEVTSVTTEVEGVVCLLVIIGVATVSAALNVYAFKLSQQRRK